MSLLREIQEGTTDHAVPISDLLRKCKMLAKRLQHEPLATWADQELNGYEDTITLPPYRRHSAAAKGTFFGPFGRKLERWPIPPLAVEEKYREKLFTATYTSGVAYYEEILRSDPQELGNPWPADFVALYGRDFIKGYTCTSVVLAISPGSVAEMLDQIRSRILSFALEIEEENPEAGEASPGEEPPVSRDKVEQIFNTIILGGTNIVASGSDNIIADFTQVVGDWSSLQETLDLLGVPGPDIDALKSAIEKDGEELPPGEAVKSWLQNIKDRVASASLILAGNATGSMIGTAVFQHLGVI